MTSEEIATRRIDTLGEAFQRLANVRFAPAQRGNSEISVRRINSEGVTGPTNVSRPRASFIIDGATQSLEGTRRGQGGLFDVEQVEVLRGPQSALQGRNALAGAVIVRTKDPTFFYEGAAAGTVGTLDTREAAAMLSGPLIPDQVAVRLVGEARSGEHDIKYLDRSLDDLDNDEYRHLRGKILIAPAALPELPVLLTGAYTEDRPAILTVNPPFNDREVTLPSAAFEIREVDVANYVADVGYTLVPGRRLRSVSSYSPPTSRSPRPAA